MSNPYAPPSPDRTPESRSGQAGPDQAGSGQAGPDQAGSGQGPDEDRAAHEGTPPAAEHPGPAPAAPGRDVTPPPRMRTNRPPLFSLRPAPPPEPDTPPDPKALALAGRLVRHFGVWLVAGVLVSLLPQPWRLATLVFLAGALVTGVRALRAVSKARVRGSLAPMLVIGLVMTAILAAGTVSSLVTWSIDADRRDCLRGAITRSAQAVCERDYQDALRDLTDSLMRRGGTS